MPYPPTGPDPDPRERTFEAPATSPYGPRPAEARTFAPPPAASVTFPHLTGARRELSVTLKVRPVTDLRRGVPAGLHLARSVRRVGGQTALFGADRVRLEAEDLKRIDADTLRHGLPLLALAPDGVGVTPVFWRTAASVRGRFALLYAGLRVDADPGRLLVELFGVEPNVAADVLGEVCVQLEAQRRAVIVRTAPDADLLARAAEAGVRGVSLDFAGVDTDSAGAVAAAQDLVAAARAAAPHVLLVNLPPRHAPAMGRAGATHAVLVEGRGELV